MMPFFPITAQYILSCLLYIIINSLSLPHNEAFEKIISFTICNDYIISMTNQENDHVNKMFISVKWLSYVALSFKLQSEDLMFTLR